jgi:hypothetical protein
MFVYIYALFYRPIPVLPSGLATQSRAMCLGRSQVDIYGPCLQVVLFWVARVNRRGTGVTEAAHWSCSTSVLNYFRLLFALSQIMP